MTDKVSPADDYIGPREEGIRMNPHIVLTNERMNCLCIVKFPHGTRDETIRHQVQEKLSGYSYGFINNSGEFLAGHYFKVPATSHDDAKGKCFRQMFKEVSTFWEIMTKPAKYIYHYDSIDKMVQDETLEIFFAQETGVTATNTSEGRKPFNILRGITSLIMPTSGRQ